MTLAAALERARRAQATTRTLAQRLGLSPDAIAYAHRFARYRLGIADTPGEPVAVRVPDDQAAELRATVDRELDLAG